AESLGDRADHAGTDRLFLGGLSSRPGEVAPPLRIDDPPEEASLAQRLGPVAFVAATGLHHGLAHFIPAQPGDQLAPPLRAARERLAPRQRANARIHLVFGHIDPDDNEIVLCHHPLPSLLGSGSKPMQLFGLRKTPGLSHAPRQALRPSSTLGLRSSDGRLVRTARSHILANFADTRARISRKTIAQGMSDRFDVPVVTNSRTFYLRTR